MVNLIPFCIQQKAEREDGELFIPPDILGRKLAEVCNPALDNCSFNTSEDDYWSVHE
jgi:hypothetical protein